MITPPSHLRRTDLLLDYAPDDLAELGPWLEMLPVNQVDAVWVAALISLFDEILPHEPGPRRQLAKAFDAVRKAYRGQNRAALTPDQELNVTEVSRLLSVHPDTVRMWQKHDGLPWRAGRGNRLTTVTEVLTWAREHDKLPPRYYLERMGLADG